MQNSVVVKNEYKSKLLSLLLGKNKINATSDL